MRTPSTETGLHPTISSTSRFLWVVDQGTGNNVYDIIGSRTLTDSIGTGPKWESGRIGGAVDIGNTGRGLLRSAGAVEQAADDVLCQGFWSCEAWVRPKALPAAGVGGGIIAFSNSGALAAPFHRAMSVNVTDDHKITAVWFDALGNTITATSASSIRAGVWSHIVVEKYDRGGGTPGVRIHINGVLDFTSGALTNTSGGNQCNWRMGTGFAGTFNGEICSVHFDTGTISTERARANFRRGMTWQNDAQAGHGTNYLDVYATTAAGGISQNLCEVGYGGVTWDFVKSVNITETVDNGAATASLEIKRNIYNLNLSPTMDSSPLNEFPVASAAATGPDARAPQDLLVPGTAITIFSKRVANQRNDPNQVALVSDALIFQGTIDTVDWASDIITIECVDQGALLIDTYIEEEAAYNTPDGSSTVEAAMQLIINNNVTGPPTLYTPVTPGWTIGPWKQRRESVLQALQSLADQIGWVVKYKWDPITEAYRLTLSDPLRDQTRYDAVITTHDYTEISRIAQSLTNVRNVIRITFSDSAQVTGRDANGNSTYERKSITRENASSIASYGRRFMEISESATSNIDTTAEANNMGDAILRDLKQPEVTMDLDLPYWEIEVGDRLLFEANNRTFDSERTFAVMGKSVSFNDNRVDVSLQLKDAPTSGVQNHIVKEAGPGRSLPPTYVPEDAPTDFGFRGYYAPIFNLMASADLLQQSPSLANVPNPAMLTMPAPSSSPPVGWTTSGTWGAYGSGDAYFSTTAESGDRSLSLNTVGATATSFWIAVMPNRTYEAMCRWQAPSATDRLNVSVAFYDVNRTVTATHVVASSVAPTALNTWQSDGGTTTTAANDRFARFIVEKAAGPPILIDRVELNVQTQAAEAFTSGALSFGVGATTIVWGKTNYNFDSFYNTANGQWTAARAGLYQWSVYAYVTATVSGSLSGIGFNLNQAGIGVVQTTMKEFAAGTTAGDHWFHTAPIRLLAGDVVTFELVVGAAAGIAAGGTTCAGYRIVDAER